ncbi:M90 family metallopeptidase [Mucilaginibacter terrae]|uniref:Mlc titration factor MtfA (PtsG expression regulator) n=1 Tax=Mucilaginibacter terrae TaxID=1955052 RepID=A0ABU3GW99_9SPHI|nr:zinc-dependent peptidase [Mucilaginibacter terrae]MDT3404044.1 Mlc titration factor MtfA (ptsG expression regulator) [Mucilaginibacter terrae]
MNTFVVVTALIVLALILAAYSLFGKKPKDNTPALSLNESLKKLLNDHVDYYTNLDDANQLRFESMIAAFLDRVHIEGVGLEITDLDRVLVASSAVIPIFGYKEWRYNNLTNVILYPDTFNNDFQFEGDENRNIMGMVGSGYMNGQMLLSRSALLHGFSKSSGKSNTGIHEFVHLLDKSDGATDGVPENLIPHEYATPWLKMMHQEINRIERGKSDIDAYAATNEAEFLAVVSEYFFEKPDQLQDKHPELYEQLSRIFAQDPAAN